MRRTQGGAKIPEGGPDPSAKGPKEGVPDPSVPGSSDEAPPRVLFPRVKVRAHTYIDLDLDICMLT